MSKINQDGIKIKKTHWSCGTPHSIEYFKNGEEHRLDGPAFISYYKDGGVRYGI
jgi:hypothetical protein